MSDPAKYLLEQSQNVHDAIDRMLPAEDTRPARLHRAMRYSVFAGGKRLRPALCIAACEACGGAAEQALDAACALELMHTSTLIHDDLPAMDNDTLRRGQPTCHIQFDEATAILAGDTLLSLSFNILAALPDGARMVQELTHCFSRVAAGQIEDLAAEKKPPDAPTVEFIHRNKTAALIRSSCIVGGLCAEAPPRHLDHLATYGEQIGLAFQLVDDLLDEDSTVEELGKDIGSDKEKGKMTWPAVYGAEATRRRTDQLTESAIEISEKLPAGEMLKALARLMATRRS